MSMSIWLVGHRRADMAANQRAINEAGSMQAICLLSVLHYKKAVFQKENEQLFVPAPSLIILDIEELGEDASFVIDSIRESPKLAGVPLFFAVSERSEEMDERCYLLGAVVIVHKKLLKAELLRVENAAWQFENTRRYEKELQRQASELQNAKEIFRLNRQLEARNQLLNKVFGRYFSEDVVDIILEAPETVSLGGEKRQATILVADLRGFTAMAENLDPEALSTLLNHYFSRMVDVILSYHGTVIEFLGDGLLAVFGALLHDASDQASDAIASAIAMQNTMKEVNDFCSSEGFPKLEMGIGLHTGEVFVGNIGSERLMRYNVAGSAVNICSRIEEATVGGQILSSKDVLLAAGVEVDYSAVGALSLKGSSETVDLFELQGIKTAEQGTLKCLAYDEEMLPLAQKPDICISILDGKVFRTLRLIPARVSAISKKRLCAELSPDTEGTPELFDTVAIVPGKGVSEKENLDTGWYARVTEKDQNSFMLHYTQIDSEGQKLIDKLMK